MKTTTSRFLHFIFSLFLLGVFCGGSYSKIKFSRELGFSSFHKTIKTGKKIEKKSDNNILDISDFEEVDSDTEVDSFTPLPESDFHLITKSFLGVYTSSLRYTTLVKSDQFFYDLFCCWRHHLV